MKSFLAFIAIFFSASSSSSAQETQSDELAELIGLVTKSTGTRWHVSYAHEARTVTFSSHGTVRGSDYSGGLPRNNVGDYSIQMVFQLTQKPTEKRIQELQALTNREQKAYERMSNNARAWAGYSKARPKRLSQKEWGEYLHYAELHRRVELLAKPTHSFMSLYLIDVSKWYVEVKKEQTSAAKQLLEDQKKILGLLTDLREARNSR